jgi:hypothetical protein
VRERFQREKPTLEQVLAATGQTAAIPLGEYLHTGYARKKNDRGL